MKKDDKYNIMSNYAKGNDFVVIDIETTGFSPDKGARIIEIGAVKLLDGKIVKKASQLINPEQPIPQIITNVTGITSEMVRNKPYYREVLPRVHEFIGDSTIVAHNSMFDWDRFLIPFFNKVGVYPKNKVIDTQVLAKNLLSNHGGLSLENLCKVMNITLEGAHRALNDAEATAYLFLKLRELIPGNQENFLISTEIKTKEATGEKQKIQNVSMWEKKVGKREMKRLYVTLDKSIVFLDVPTMAWEVKKSNCEVDFSLIEKDVLKFASVKNKEELIQKYS